LARDPPPSTAPVLFRLALHRWQKKVVSYRGFALLVAVQMSALGQADIRAAQSHVRFAPESD